MRVVSMRLIALPEFGFRNTVPDHNIRYGKVEVIDGELVQVKPQ
jgi:hypothetical protein